MPTEIAEGGQATIDAMQRMRDSSLPEEERFTSDFTDHDPAAGQPVGPTGMAWFWEQFGKAFSDLDREIIETIVTPTKYITIMNLSGTQRANSSVTLRRESGSRCAMYKWSASVTARCPTVGGRPTSSASCCNSACSSRGRSAPGGGVQPVGRTTSHVDSSTMRSVNSSVRSAVSAFFSSTSVMASDRWPMRRSETRAKANY